MKNHAYTDASVYVVPQIRLNISRASEEQGQVDINQSMEPQARERPFRAERDSASNLSNNSGGLKGGNLSSAFTEGADGGNGRSGVGTSNGTHDASIGDAKIGGQPPAASAGVGGEPGNSDSALRWVPTRWKSLAVRWLGVRANLDLSQYLRIRIVRKGICAVVRVHGAPCAAPVLPFRRRLSTRAFFAANPNARFVYMCT